MMKRFVLIVLIPLALLVLQHLPIKITKASPRSVSLAEARHAAILIVNHLGKGSYTEFDQATIDDDATPFYYSTGDTSAYVFRVRTSDQIRGYIAIGATKDDEPFLEASRAMPPQDRLEAARAQILAKYPSNVILGTPRLLYPNALSFIAEFPVFQDGQLLATEYFHLRQGRLITKNQVPPDFTVTNTEHGRKVWKAMLSTKNLVYKEQSSSVISPMVFISRDISGVPSYSQYYSTWWDSACGPTVASEMAEFWRQHGYPGIRGLAYYGDVGAFIDHMYLHMSTWTGTTVANFVSGLSNHLAETGVVGYTISSTLVPNTTWAEYHGQIYNGSPVGIRIEYTPWENTGDGNYEYHWVVGYGYEYDDNLGWHGMHIYNSWSNDPTQAADVLDYDRYQSYLNFVKFH
ncbi:MAG: hypothetical protein M1299_09585 [Firmicutes bacterium]|nr:hypothetical protein [Bacillota bacterium]MCL5040057.1 hypothetical protein [Bacillota bacterium]